MSWINRLVLVLCLCFCLSLPVHAEEPSNDVLYQISTVAKLKAGYYASEQSVADIKAHGDFGIGSFTGLDGEMVFLDGRVWQVPVDGVPREMPDNAGVPFAQVTRFSPDQSFVFKDVTDYDDFQARLLEQLPGEDMLYAVRVSGTFASVKARSVPRSEPPYPTLAEVIEMQAVFPLAKVEGVMVGWHTPSYMTGVGAPGLHLHFLSKAFDKGGHVLGFAAKEVRVELDATPDLLIHLPENTAY